MSDDKENKDPEDQVEADAASDAAEAALPDDAPAVAEPMDNLDADAVIEAFGGIRPMAAKLEVAVSTVQGWKARSHIPDNRWRDIIAAAGANQIDLSAALKTDQGSGEPADAEEPEPQVSEPSPWQSDDETPEREQDHPAADDEEEAPQPEVALVDAPPPSETRKGGGLTLLLAVVAIVGVVTRPVWAPYVDPHLGAYMPTPGTPIVEANDPAVAEAVTQIGATVSQLSDRVASLEDRPVSTGDGSGGTVAVPPELTARLSAIESDLASVRESTAAMDGLRTEVTAGLNATEAALQGALERDEESRARIVERIGVLEARLRQIAEEAENATAALAGLSDRIDAHDADITALEERPALEAAAQAGLALAVGDVEAAIADGRPFAAAVERLGGLAPAGTDIANAAAQLAPYGEAGVPTRAALRAAFELNAPAMQSELGRTEGDALETLLEGARSLISIRRTGESPEAPPVSRAEAALDRGDLASAIAALAPVRDQSDTVAAWLAGAEARLGVEAALADLRVAVGTLLSGAGEAESGSDDTVSDGDG